MSIEQEKFDGENTESSLEQYGVWVKKSPAEENVEEVPHIGDESTEDDDSMLDITMDDLETDSFEIFSDDENVTEENFDIGFDEDGDMQLDSSIEDDTSDTTLTSDELLNITSEMNEEEPVENKIEDTDNLQEPVIDDIDFDTFMDMDIEENDSDFEDTEESFVVESDESADFDLMTEEVISSESTEVEEETVAVYDDTDDFDISFDDFMEEDTTTTYAGEADTNIQSEEIEVDVSFDDEEEDITVTSSSEEDFSIPSDDDEDISFMDIPNVSEETVMIDETENEAEIEQNIIPEDEMPIDFGEEITLDDIPESTTSTEVQEEAAETVQDYNIHIESEENAQVEETKGADTNTNDVLSQIVSELTNLRNEMSQFKSELAKIKTDKTASPAKNNDGEEEGGFFSDYEGDDTIALSGDELNNILTSADFTVDDNPAEDESDDVETNDENIEETIVEDSSSNENETFDISEEAGDDTFIEDESFEIEDDYFSIENTEMMIEDKELVEPSLENIDFDMDSDETLPDEIEVPVIEDLVVDSSPVNFFDDEEDEPKELDDTSMQYLAEEPESDEIFTSDEAEAEVEVSETENEIVDNSEVEQEDVTIFETDSTEPTESTFEETQVVDEDFIIDEQEDDSDDSFDAIEIDEKLSPEISDSEIIDGYTEPDSNAPVSSVFNSDQWETAIAEDDNDIVEDDVVSNVNTDMQEEIKSVLAYMDRLLESLPEEKISEFAQSEYFGRYKKLFTDLGIS